MVETTPYTRNQLLSTLLKTGHKDLAQYTDVGLRAAIADPDLFGHFVAWNVKMGKIRDAKKALPVLALRGLGKADRDLAENAIACLLSLSPTDLVKAYDYNLAVTTSGRTIPAGWRRLLEQGIQRYLRERESRTNWWIKTAVQHRRALKRLYRLSHTKPSGFAQGVLFDRQWSDQSVFGKIAALRTMPPAEQAAVILQHSLPFEVVVGAADVKNEAVLLALIEGMTGNQIITNSQMLERLGVTRIAALRASYDAAILRAKSDTRVEALKAGQAAVRVTDAGTKAKLEKLQEVQTAQLGGIDGDWLVLGDRSGSMSASIELARKIAALITERVKGKVYLVFFNIAPTAFEVTGLSYEKIVEATRRVSAGGGTSIGCGLDYVLSNRTFVQGIAIVSDGGENTSPRFATVYQKYAEAMAVEPTVYLFHVPGEADSLSGSCAGAGIPLERFDASQLDYYSLPNLVQTLRTNRYQLVDEILAYPLLTFERVFNHKEV